MDIRSYIAENRTRFYEEWASLIRIQSVSCQPEHKSDMQRCAERWCQLLLAAGCQKARVMPSDGNPFVYAEYMPDYIEDKQVPTVLVYAHYDVMPVEPLDQWVSNPWEPDIRDGRLYARGADDDKGQAMIQAKAFEYMVREGLMKCRVKFIFEGEEEIGSPSLEAFLHKHKELLACDIILVSDTSMIGKDTPSITTGLRGLAYWQIEVDGPNRDLHSGHFGGAVKNPINALCEMLAQVVDRHGRITIPHFYDDVLPIPADERDMIAQIPSPKRHTAVPLMWMLPLVRRDTPPWNETPAVHHLTFAVFGAATRVMVARLSCRPKHLPKSVAAWWQTKTMSISVKPLPAICNNLHPLVSV